MKSEPLNPSPDRSTKAKTRNAPTENLHRAHAAFGLRPSDFGLLSAFGLRTSDFAS